MIKLSCTFKDSPIRLRLTLTCALSVLAACSQGTSSSNTTALGTDNSLADAPPPATALPLATGPASAYRPAPVASALPPAPSASLGRVPSADRYAYLNQAQAFSQSLADAPPDYTYDYNGERPWVWQSPDGYYRVAERLPMGVRYFYYAPGASTPYLVQDPQYSYGYSGDQLTVVYGPGGEVLPDDMEARQARAAGVYLAWAAGLYAAARHEHHVAVAQERWDAERQAVYADQARWTAARQRNSDWMAYSQAHQNDQAHWADQRYVRAAEAARFAQTVHDQTAFAHAQQAATDARAIAQSRGQRAPGPSPQGGFEHRDPADGAAVPDDLRRRQTAAEPPARQPTPEQASPPSRARAPHAVFERNAQAVRAPELAGGDVVDAQRQQALQRQAESHTAAQGLEQGRAQQAAQAAASRQAAAQAHEVQAHDALARQSQAREQQAAAHQAEAAAAAERAGSDRPAVDARRQAAMQATPQAQAPSHVQALEARQASAPPARPQIAPPAPAAPRPEPPPAKAKAKPDDPHH